MSKKTQIAKLLRKEQTNAESKLWRYLRNRQFEDLKFRRQHPLKEYIVDFFCAEYGIVIELDGEYHNELNQTEKDKLRDIHLQELGYAVIRIKNKLVFESIDTIFQFILKAKQKAFSSQGKDNLAERKKIRNKHLTPTLSSRRRDKTVLSTKILAPSQKELLLNANLNLVQYDAIKIEFLSVKIENGYDYFVFTSQNGVHAFLNNYTEFNKAEKKVFCVGDKTKTLLEQNRFKVVEIAQNSLELGKIIAKKYKKSSFLLFSGNLRRHELPDTLTKNNIQYKELEIYHTHLNYKQFNRNFNGVLFFSPSGVQSFIKENKLDYNWAFCIGETTATEAKKHTSQVIIANKPTVENVLVQAIKYFNSHLYEKDIN